MKELQRISTAKVLINAEETIFRVLNQLDEDILSNKKETTLIDLIYSLTNKQNGNISIPCCILIANKLNLAMKYRNDIRFQEIIEDIKKTPNQCQIVVFGIMLKTKQCPKEIAGVFIDSCFSNFSAIPYSCIFGLRCAFKCFKNGFSEYDEKVFSLASKTCSEPPESIQMISLKLMRSLIKRRYIGYSNIMAQCILCMNKRMTPFVQDEASKTYAMCMAYDFFNNRKDGLSAILSGFNQNIILESVSQYFLSLILPKINDEELMEYMKYLFIHFPVSYSYISNFCSENIKSKLLKILTEENDLSYEQIFSLFLICFDAESYCYVTEYSLKSSQIHNSSYRDSLYRAFVLISKETHQIVEQVLVTLLVLMSSERVKNGPRIMSSSLFSKLMASYTEKNSFIEKNSQYIRELIDFLFSNISIDISFTINFLFVMSVLPKEISHDAIVFNKFNNYIMKYLRNQSSSLEYLDFLEALLQFLSIRSDYEMIENLEKVVCDNINSLSSQALGSIVILCKSSVNNNITGSNHIIEFFNRVLENNPISSSFLKGFLLKPIPSSEDMITSPFKNCTFYNSNETFLKKFINSIPFIISHFPEDHKKTYLDSIFKGIPNTIKCLIVKKVLESEKFTKYIPKGFLVPFLKHIKGYDYIFIQADSECISEYIRLYPQYLDPTIRFIESNKTIASTILISSILMNCELTVDCIFQLFMVLSERINVPSLRPFALLSYMKLLSKQNPSVSIIIQVFYITLRSLLSDASLHPYVFSLIVMIFEIVFQLLSNEKDGKSKDFYDSVIGIISLTSYMPYAYSKSQSYHLFDVSLCGIITIPPIPITINPVFYYSNHLLGIISAKLFNHSCKLGLECNSNQSIEGPIYFSQMTNSSIVYESIINIIISQSKDKSFDLIPTLNIIGMILKNGKLHDSSVSFNNTLKHCLLISIEKVFPNIIDKSIVQTDVVNSMISIVCNTISLFDNAIVNVSFAVLTNIVYFLKTNEVLFSHYFDSLLEMARIGFSLGLEVAFSFLCAFICDKTECFVLYFLELSRNKEQTDQHTFLAVSLISTLSHSDCNTQEQFIKESSQFSNEIIHTLIRIVSISYNDLMKGLSISHYFDGFFSQLLSSSVWLMSKTHVDIDISVLLSFIIIILWKSKDTFERVSTIEALQVFFDCNVSFDQNDLTNEVLNSLLFIVDECDLEAKSIISDICVRISQLRISETEWNLILHLYLRCPPKSEMLLNLIEHCNIQNLSNNGSGFVNSILKGITYHTIQEKSGLEIFDLFLKKSRNIDIVSIVIQFPKLSPPLCFNIFKSVLSFGHVINIKPITDYCTINYLNGGLEFIAWTMHHFPEFGMSLFSSSGAVCALSHCCHNDAEIAKSIALIDLAIPKINNNREFIEDLFKSYIKIIQNSLNRQHLPYIVHSLKNLITHQSDLLQHCWDTITVNERVKTMLVLQES